MRLIARLDIKNENVIKGIHLEGLRVVGNPNQLALKYYDAGIDEIIFMDAVASLYDRNNLFHIIEQACSDIFIPIAVGGGIRTVEDVSAALAAGADKVVINTGAVRDINFIKEAAQKFGSQCIVGSIEAKKIGSQWQAYIDNGREPTGKEVIEWAKILAENGVGEIVITSIDQEGTGRGFDLELISKINENVRRPIVISGGYSKQQHLKDLLEVSVPSAVAFASVLHYEQQSVDEIRAIISETRN